MNACVILAAGTSSRFGRPKQLVEIDGEALVARAVRIAREAGLEPYVVVGADAEQVEAVVAAAATVVRNENFRDGIGSSVAAGIERVASDGARTAIVMPCDLPRVTAADLRGLLVALEDADAAAATYDEVVGTPACFRRGCFDDLGQIDADRGAQSLLRDGRWQVETVEMPRAAHDVDVPADLEPMRKT